MAKPPDHGQAATRAYASLYERVRMQLRRLDAALPLLVKIALPIIVVIIITGGASTWFIYDRESDHIRGEFEEQALLITRSIEVGTAGDRELLPRDEAIEKLQRLIDALAKAEPSLLLINIYGLQNGEQVIIASSGPRDAPALGPALSEGSDDIQLAFAGGIITEDEQIGDAKALEVIVPLHVSGQPGFVIGAYFSTGEREAALAELLRTSIIGTVAVSALTMFVLYIVLRMLLFKRLSRLLDATSRMEAGDYSARVEGAPDVDTKDEMVRLGTRFNAMAGSIEALYGQLKEAASTDPLTGLHNRRFAMEALEREVHVARRRESSFGLIVVDLDGLKAMNDRHGHATGDAVLLQIGHALQGAIRAGDIVTRFGGDEFLVIMPDCNPESLQQAMERIQLDAEARTANSLDDGSPLRFTVSAGGSILRQNDSIATLLSRADLALYEAKGAGRNCVRFAA